MDTSINVISAILSYLPHGSSEGWDSQIIHLSIMWLNSLNTANSAGFPSILGFHVTSSVFKIKSYQFFGSFRFIRYKSLKELDVLQRLSSTGFFVLL